MIDSALLKFEQIVAWYADRRGLKSKGFVAQSDPGRLEELENAIGAKLPDSIRRLFNRYDGEFAEAEGLFLGHGLMSIDRIMDDVAFAQSLIKPANPYVENEVESQVILSAIVKQILHAVDSAVRASALSNSWTKCEFDCGPGSIGGPYVYSRGDADREIVNCDMALLKCITGLAVELHATECHSYNWDELKFVVGRDGSFTVNRDFYNLTDEENFTSFPDGAIRRTYFNLRWVPLIRDFGGNNIGVDIDPGPNGKYGQIIVYGGDENDMYVLADDWEAFLDMILDLIKNRADALLNCGHLHDFLQPIVRARGNNQHG